MARVATSSTEDGLDIVQDTMMAFVKCYATRPENEWPPLFFKVLQNRIRDWYRRQAVRNRWRGWIGTLNWQDDGREQEDPMAGVADNKKPGPAASIETRDAMAALEVALHGLPLRQQQVFLLRAWEGLSVKETSVAMGCSQGSVKSHYARAVKSLRHLLEDHRS